MSYYKHHVFFCVNQRDDGRQCCNQHDAEGMRGYAKDCVRKLNLSGKGKVRVNLAGCLDRCEEGPVMVVYPQCLVHLHRQERHRRNNFRTHSERACS